MSLRLFAALAAALVFVATSPADARRYHGNSEETAEDGGSRSSARRHRFAEASDERRSRRHHARSSRSNDDDGEVRGGRHSNIGARPSAWCGWYMRTRHGGGPELNLAANWGRRGRPGAPQVGAIVVWPHHVGEIVGRSGNQWVVLSGNDGGQVRSRPRSIAGAQVRIL